MNRSVAGAAVSFVRPGAGLGGRREVPGASQRAGGCLRLGGRMIPPIRARTASIQASTSRSGSALAAARVPGRSRHKLWWCPPGQSLRHAAIALPAAEKTGGDLDGLAETAAGA